MNTFYKYFNLIKSQSEAGEGFRWYEMDYKPFISYTTYIYGEIHMLGNVAIHASMFYTLSEAISYARDYMTHHPDRATGVKIIKNKK